jgi:hypothetical protein
VREVKIEADAKTPGFAAAPEIVLQFEPAQLVFLASGQGPFTLAAAWPGGGRCGAFLPMASLIPGYKPRRKTRCPWRRPMWPKRTSPAAAPVAGPLVAAQPPGDGMPTRSLVLWGIAAGVRPGRRWAC